MILSNMEMVLAKAEVAIALRYAGLVEGPRLAQMVFAQLRAEWRRTVDALLTITEQATLVQRNPLLARSIRHRVHISRFTQPHANRAFEAPSRG
jgi:phosphoenolpyruvate carboxylase